MKRIGARFVHDPGRWYDLEIACKSEFLPHRGFRWYFSDTESILARMQFLFLRDPELFSDEKIIRLAAICDETLSSIDEIAAGRDPIIRRLEGGGSASTSVSDPSRIVIETDFRWHSDKHVFKYVSQFSWDAYYSKGIFRLGDLTGYRAMESSGSVAGDRYEGAVSLFVDLRDHHFFCNLIAGFNFLIFSSVGSLTNKSQMQEKFGPVILKIEVRPFVKAVQAAIGCGYPEVRPVLYTDYKICRRPEVSRRILKSVPKVTTEFVMALERLARRPSIFIKPHHFVGENEVRLAFPLTEDVTGARIVSLQESHRFVSRVD